jgi:multiple antibiotic resistance protein
VSSYFDVQLFLSVFVTLLVIMNPPGAVPIFLGLTTSLTHTSSGRSRHCVPRWLLLG